MSADSSSVTFSLPATVANPIESNDQIMLLYKLGSVNVLADPGQKINMTAKTSDAANPAQTIPVAQSIRAIDAHLTPIEAGILHIAVSTGSTQFSGEPGTVGEVVGYINNNVAQISAVTVSTAGPQVKREDGVSSFRIASDEVKAEKSTLIISGGQFEASKALPGKVSLHNEKTDLDADNTTSDSEGAWTATWNLDSDELSDITSSSEPTSLRIRTNGTDPVNTIENPPHAILKIDFDDAGYQDIIAEADLRKISKDGTVCTVFNVPPPKAGVIGADTLAIRVTNRSTISGKLMGKLYSQDGGDPIWSGDLTTEEVPSWATARFTSEDIATISGQTWDGRAVLEISTTLPNIEVLALIRQNGIRMAPLSNLSEGVVPSCVMGGN